MKFTAAFINCEEDAIIQLTEVQEILRIISKVPWQASRVEAVSQTGKKVYWQNAYNRLFEIEFEEFLWKKQPLISTSPLHKVDFAKKQSVR